MVNQLLDISRLEAGQMPLDKEECDLVAMVHASIRSLGSLLGEGRHLEILATDPILALCDPSIVGRVINNLLSNAFKFTPEGGKVRVQVVRAGDSVRCLVSDTGPGIPPKYHLKIFDKFGQVESGNERSGVGLGLTFCKLAIEAHGGTIGVESKAGKGSTFWFTLPVA
jgi:signal transduction histidine kinase